MDPSTVRRPMHRSPIPPSTSESPDRARASSKQSGRPSSKQSGRPSSSDSDTSASSHLSVMKRSPFNHQLPNFISQNSSNTSLPYHRPSAQYMPNDSQGQGQRRTSGLAPPPELQRHRPRQHSQGYFEPSMPSASLASQSALHDPNQTGMSASHIAAQAAFQHLNTINPNQHNRKRSQTVPFPENPQDTRRSSRGSATSSQDEPQSATSERPQYKNGLIGNNAATTAASAAFPRNFASASTTSLVEEKEPKRGLKRFKPKNITLSRDKDKDAKDKPLPSPNKMAPSGLSKVMNASTASLADSLSSNNTSLYSLVNPSQTTIIPIPEPKDKRSGLRQKLKLKDKDDHHTLALSSAHSTSRPVDFNNPQSLYSFAPSSPGPTSSFAKTMSGLDLRHGGRALREKKKEEKAQAQAALEQVNSRDSDTSEWPSLSNAATNNSASWTPYATDLTHTLSGFGVNNMTPDDAWDFLKAKLLAVFEGEVVRIAVEDLNRLVSIHIQRCVQKRDPSAVIGDLEDLLNTGFLSLNHTMRSIPDDRLVPHLVNMWMMVFGTVLPFMQAVFLPLDQEFKGRGSVLTTPKLAAEFWGVAHNPDGHLSASPGSTSTTDEATAAGEELEVRRILLIQYRDIVILPRFDVLKATFSRLSLESINATLTHLDTTSSRLRGNSDGSDRPGTAQSASATLDPTYASFNSQASTLLDSSSSRARSRAASNLSQVSTSSSLAQEVAFQSFSSPPTTLPSSTSSSQVTETVGRMLQCLSVLCSVQTGDDSQTKMEELNRQLKLNWLGRGRTGRNRKGFVGTRVRHVRSVGSTIRGVGGAEEGNGNGVGGGGVGGSSMREGSPTPTPTRQGTVSRGSDYGDRSVDR